MSELLVVFVIIFIIYGAGWIWQTVNDILRDSSRGSWAAGPRSRAARVLLGGHDLSDLARVWQRFAEERRGEMHARQLFQSPKVSFVHQGARALLSVYESGDAAGPLHTQLTYTVPEGWPYRLELYPRRRPDEDGPSANDIPTGQSEFDARYVVKANDEKFAREYLDGATRTAVEDLRSLLGNDRILVSMNPSRLMIRKESVIDSSETLEALAGLSGRLHDRIDLFWQRASGIEILEDPVAPDAAAEAVCQICGSKITAETKVVCRRCSTPHHEDCWEFNGRCSTYACGEKRFASKK
ncbi:MAG TPA: RING finger protein [Planctomycetota bacterium]|nr:RING finger protein [Planctomycetota bacterium]